MGGSLARLSYTIAKQRSDYPSDVLVRRLCILYGICLNLHTPCSIPCPINPNLSFLKLTMTKIESVSIILPAIVAIHYFCRHRYFDCANITPRYGFGFGLSYTTFAYSGLTIKVLNKVSTNIQWCSECQLRCQEYRCSWWQWSCAALHRTCFLLYCLTCIWPLFN